MNNLTGLELDVLGLIIEGYTNKQIAEKILYSPSLVNKKVSELLKRFKVSNRTQLAIMFKNYDKINTWLLKNFRLYNINGECNEWVCAR